MVYGVIRRVLKFEGRWRVGERGEEGFDSIRERGEGGGESEGREEEAPPRMQVELFDFWANNTSRLRMYSSGPYLTACAC